MRDMRDLVTPKIFAKAIQNSLEYKMRYEEAKGIAEKTLNFFGYDDRIYDNILNKEERDLFNMLESIGLLSTTSEELTLYNDKEWRIYYWVLKKNKIFERVKYKKPKVEAKPPENVYEQVPDGVWRGHAKAVA